jgi:outer membrane protein OmpA-like peptidoglycan-associated protein
VRRGQTVRLVWTAALACAVGLGAGCRPLAPHRDSIPLPPRDEAISFFDSRGAALDHARFRPIAFAPGRYELTAIEETKVRAMAAALGPDERLLLAGVGEDEPSPEWNRVLSERRALAVRDALVRAGVDPSRIQTASSGADVTGNGVGRVEVAVIKP